MNIGRDAMGVMGETERRASRSMRSLITDLCGFRRRNKARLSDYRQSVEAQLSRGSNGEAKHPRRWRPRAKHQAPAALRFM